MTESDTPIFEPAVERFAAYYETVRGHVRQEVIRTRIEHDVRDALLVLDYGGGDGRDSVWVAQHGVQVEYWDPTPAENERAKEAVDTAGLTKRIKIHDSDPLQDTTARFDLIMLHGVIQYIETEQAREIIEKAAKSLIRGGIISLATSNLVVVHQAGSPEGSVSINNLDLPSRAYSAAYISSWLENAGFVTPDIKGVRCISDKDFRKWKSIPKEELKAILSEEKHSTTREDSIERGKMLHVVALKG